MTCTVISATSFMRCPFLAPRVLAGLLATAALPPLAAAPLEVTVTDGAGKPLADAVVYADSPQAHAAVKPAAGIEIAQQKKQFVPQVSIVPVGSAVNFPNRDTVRHHVYSFSPVKPFEIKLYVGTPASPVRIIGVKVKTL